MHLAWAASRSRLSPLWPGRDGGEFGRVPPGVIRVVIGGGRIGCDWTRG